MVSIQYVSDLHLEFRETEAVQSIISVATGQILILAGDICPVTNVEDEYTKLFIRFLSHYCPKFEHILHVPGNHEYYDITDSKCTVDKINKFLSSLSKIYPNYHFLNNDTFTYTKGAIKYTFIGSPLWTSISKKNEADYRKKINDGHKIFIKKPKKDVDVLDVKARNQWHRSCVSFIKSTATAFPKVKPANTKRILIVHHKPFVGTYPPTDIANPTILDEAYETNSILDMLRHFDLVVYGHTHQSSNISFGETFITSNPRGYPYEQTRFDKHKDIIL